jgi:hypothetical protein
MLEKNIRTRKSLKSKPFYDDVALHSNTQKRTTGIVRPMFWFASDIDVGTVKTGRPMVCKPYTMQTHATCRRRTDLCNRTQCGMDLYAAVHDVRLGRRIWYLPV